MGEQRVTSYRTNNKEEGVGGGAEGGRNLVNLRFEVSSGNALLDESSGTVERTF